MDDWYRGSDWDLSTRETFEERLSRARGQRSQYLLIKGMGLVSSREEKVRQAGMELLGRVLDEHPDDQLNGARALEALAGALKREGMLDDALAR